MRLALVDVVNKQRNNNNSSSRRRSQSNLPFPFHFLHSIHNNTLLLLLFFFFTFMVKLSHLVFRVQMKWLIVLRWLWVKLNCEMFCVSCVWLQWNSCARILWMKTPTQTDTNGRPNTRNLFRSLLPLFLYYFRFRSYSLLWAESLIPKK